MGTGRYALGGSGTQTAGLGAGGFHGPPATIQNLTEEYDGSSWTASNAMPITLGSTNAQSGTQTASITTGGNNPSPGYVNATLEYDGSNWTTLPATIATARTGLGGDGSNTSSFIAGGETAAPAVSNSTEEFTGAGPATVSIDTD
jgi:hypothetical protein